MTCEEQKMFEDIEIRASMSHKKPVPLCTFRTNFLAREEGIARRGRGCRELAALGFLAREIGEARGCWIAGGKPHHNPETFAKSMVTILYDSRRGFYQCVKPFPKFQVRKHHAKAPPDRVKCKSLPMLPSGEVALAATIVR